LKRWNSTNILKKALTYKNSSHEGIKADLSQEMIAIIWCSKSCLSTCYTKI